VHGTVALVAAMNDTDPQIAADAIHSLTFGHSIGRDGGPYVAGDANTKRIAEGMQDQSAEKRKAAMEEYAKLPIKQATAPGMWKFALLMLDDPSPQVRATAFATCRTVLTALLKDQVAMAQRIPFPTTATTRTTTTQAVRP
jgi:hypothetical protein